VVRSWALTALSLLGVPIGCTGRSGGDRDHRWYFLARFSVGLGAVLALMVRQGVGLVCPFPAPAIERGRAVSGSAGASRRPGAVPERHRIIGHDVRSGTSVRDHGRCRRLEIAHPLAVVVLGGVVTLTLGTLLVLPSLYARFGAGWTADRLDLEMDTAS